MFIKFTGQKMELSSFGITVRLPNKKGKVSEILKKKKTQECVIYFKVETALKVNSLLRILCLTKKQGFIFFIILIWENK